MIVLIMTDKLPFGAPPLLACLLLVVVGISTVQEAFAGFVNPSVIMIAGFMVVLTAVQKTKIIGKLKSAMITLINRGGYKSYALLVVLVMLGASLVGGGNTGYYVLILSLLTTIPYNKNLPTSKLMLPLGFATGTPIAPFNVALHFGVAASVLETAGYTGGGFSMVNFSLMNVFLAVGYLAWCLIGYRLLPDHAIAEASAEAQAAQSDANAMSSWQENCTIIAFVVSVLGMMLTSQLGAIANVIPGIAATVLLFINVLNFKEVRDSMGAPVILMMAGVIGVADALANSGFTDMVGTAAANVVSGISPFLIIVIFALLTSTMATFTGSNMGSVFVFAPIAISACTALGLNPMAAAAAVTVSGWNGGYMPIDGMPALIYGMGKYSLGQFWKFTLPMYFIRIFAVCLGAIIVFPM
jgi:di/tricarboxylate transporter